MKLQIQYWRFKMTDINIAKAELKDVADIARISYQVGKMHDEAVPEYFKPTDEKEHLRVVSEMLKEENVVVFKAVCKGQICGFLFLEMIHRQSKGLAFSKIGNILNLGVDETCRSKGIGTQLVEYAEDFVLKQGGEALDLNVFAFNKGAIKLYERLGYKTIDVSMRKVLK